MGSMRRVKLGDVALVEISGVDKKTNEGEVSVRLCNYTDVYKNWAITSSMHDSFMGASANEREIAKFSLHRGQVAVTKDSETRDDIGIPTYIADNFDDVILGYHCALITPDETQLNGKYLNAFLHTDFIHKFFSANASGSGQRYTLSIETLNSIPIYLPSLEEQERIGNIFSSIDRKIELNRQINDYLEAMASQLYDYWFVQFDFPDKNGKPYKSSGGKMVWCNKLKREIPDEWMILSINDLATTCRGVSYDASQVSDTKTPKHDILVLRGNNIKNSHIVLDSNTAYISSSLVSPEQRIHRHDIIMTMSSGSKEHLGKCGMFQFDSQHTFGAFLTKLTPKKDYHYYVFSFLMSAWYKAKIKSICNGTGINNLTNEIFNQVLLPVPPNQYICLFNSTVSASFDRIGENEMQTEELSKQRDELLPLLMNGQVSVKQLNNHLSHD